MPACVTFEHYEVLIREDGSPHELGRGAMGITYKGFDTRLRVPVALKVINTAYLNSDMARQRFIGEARAAARLRHRNVASVFHLGQEGDNYFYVMEFIDGETLDSRVKKRGPVPPSAALRIAAQVARALNAAQAHKLVHRDIKPSNLMIVHEDDEDVVKVIDFGLAKILLGDSGESTALAPTVGFLGTPQFASPEQLEEQGVDVRSDIYSLGVTLWYLLKGKVPFVGSIAQVMNQHISKPPPFEELEGVPEPAVRLLRKMLEKDPAMRHQTAAELRQDIEQCLGLLGEPGDAAEVEAPPAPCGFENAPPVPLPPVEETAPPAEAQPEEGMTVPPETPVALPPPAASPPPRRGPHPLVIALGIVTILAAGTAVHFIIQVLNKPKTSPPQPKANPASAELILTPPVANQVIPVQPIAVIPSPPPSPPPTRRELLNTARLAAEALEANQLSHKAAAAWLVIMRDYPESDLGRVNLEILLQRLRKLSGGLSRSEFDKMRPEITEAARLDVLAAMMILGEQLQRREPAAAFAWFCAASEKGEAVAMTQAGLMLSNGDGPGDLSKAIYYLSAAAEKGEPNGQAILAECYLLGLGTVRDLPRAIDLLRKASATGVARARNRLGVCYHKGTGVVRDDAQALRLFTEAADAGNAEAVGNLGVLYMNGEGVKKDMKKAVAKFKEASLKGDVNSMLSYARCLQEGFGTTANLPEATSWFRKAAEAGNSEAATWCKDHGVEFTPPLPKRREALSRNDAVRRRGCLCPPTPYPPRMTALLDQPDDCRQAFPVPVNDFHRLTEEMRTQLRRGTAVKKFPSHGVHGARACAGGAGGAVFSGGIHG